MSLDRLLREHYRSKSLRPAVMDEILAATPAHTGRWATVRRMLLPAAAALLAVAVLLPLVNRSSLEPAIRREVATNHRKLLAPEFVESDLGRLRSAMDDLDFRLVASATVRDRGLRLVGARYCSIQGRLAAQLQLEDRRGRSWTLYQAPLDGFLAEVKAGVEEVDGVLVELWKETGVLLALASDEAGPAETDADWPGFRGPDRDGSIRGVRIETDWSRSPPVELWRRPIGPGISSFAVRGDLLYTQEQSGDNELVVCYKVSTGEPVWRHHYAARFWDKYADAGPRATPTLSDGRVYTFGATGIVNALDAGDGAVVWSRNAASDTAAKLPEWGGFTSSPLVVDDVVIVYTETLVAYDLATGDPRWFGPTRGEGYSSPHLVTIDGVAQILMLWLSGATSVAPADGALLWEYRWGSDKLLQPALTADGDILIGTWNGPGTRRIAVAHGPGGWTIEERWTSNRLKPDFSDFVVHDGHAFGFDGTILASIDVEDGKRKWKGGRYGRGQLILLADQDVLLVVSEQGELALVAASPDQFTELARFPAIEGKTWNHPVLVGDVLLVRNRQEMAAFRLSLAGG